MVHQTSNRHIQAVMNNPKFINLDYLAVWQSPSKEEDHYTFRTIPQEHW